jgi:hypothetical protein
VVTHSTAGAISDADATPTFDVYEEATDTGLLGATNFTKRTSLTGNYRGTFTASAANGFEVGKWYNVVASATVGGTAGKAIALTFMLRAAEHTAGYEVVTVKSGTGTGELNVASGIVDADVRELVGVAPSATDLKDFADDGYDPSTNKVQGVVLVDTLTTYTGNTPQTADHTANIAAILVDTAEIGAAGAGLTVLATAAALATAQADLDTITGTAEAALARGDLSKARAAYERAINHDDRYAAPHDGLCRLEFHRGKYAKAARHGEKAVRMAARDATMRIHLGDAYYKAYRYDRAKAQYAKAKELGDSRADARLKKAEAKLGG